MEGARSDEGVWQRKGDGGEVGVIWAWRSGWAEPRTWLEFLVFTPAPSRRALEDPLTAGWGREGPRPDRAIKACRDLGLGWCGGCEMAAVGGGGETPKTSAIPSGGSSHGPRPVVPLHDLSMTPSSEILGISGCMETHSYGDTPSPCKTFCYHTCTWMYMHVQYSITCMHVHVCNTATSYTAAHIWYTCINTTHITYIFTL